MGWGGGGGEGVNELICYELQLLVMTVYPLLC